MKGKTAELFHRLWGKAKDHDDYNKEEWVTLQNLLEGRE